MEIIYAENLALYSLCVWLKHIHVFSNSVVCIPESRGTYEGARQVESHMAHMFLHFIVTLNCKFRLQWCFYNEVVVCALSGNL